MTGRESGENGWNTGKSGDGRIVLCGANSYEQKYYFNPDFKMLPKSVQEELHILCVLYTEDVGGIFTIIFEPDGGVTLETTAAEEDFTVHKKNLNNFGKRILTSIHVMQIIFRL